MVSCRRRRPTPIHRRERCFVGGRRFCLHGRFCCRPRRPRLSGSTISGKTYDATTSATRCWPEPFSAADREATIAPFGQMVANGWRRQNLISDYHFNDEDTQLTVAGEQKVRYILTQKPPSRRTIFVQQGLTPERPPANERGAPRRGADAAGRHDAKRGRVRSAQRWLAGRRHRRGGAPLQRHAARPAADQRCSPTAAVPTAAARSNSW